MQDGYDWDYVCFDECTPMSSVMDALRELAQSASEAISSLADELHRLLGVTAESLEKVIEAIAQYAEECRAEDSENKSFSETVNCYIPESGYLLHRYRIPFHTSGFQ